MISNISAVVHRFPKDLVFSRAFKGDSGSFIESRGGTGGFCDVSKVQDDSEAFQEVWRGFQRVFEGVSEFLGDSRRISE